MAKVNTAKELGEALDEKIDTIEIEGDLAKASFRIRATGTVTWAVAIGAIGIAFYSVANARTKSSASTTAVAAGLTATAAVGILGGAATTTAIAIAIAAGGVGALSTLRSYKEVSRTENTLILKRA